VKLALPKIERKKFDQAKQALFAPPSVPSISVVPYVTIPLVGIMDRIVRIDVEMSNAHAATVAQNTNVAASSIDVGLLTKLKGMEAMSALFFPSQMIWH